MSAEWIPDADGMVRGECDHCGRIDDAGFEAARATHFKCGWCHRGAFHPIEAERQP